MTEEAIKVQEFVFLLFSWFDFFITILKCYLFLYSWKLHLWYFLWTFFFSFFTLTTIHLHILFYKPTVIHCLSLIAISGLGSREGAAGSGREPNGAGAGEGYRSRRFLRRQGEHTGWGNGNRHLCVWKEFLPLKSMPRLYLFNCYWHIDR